MKIENIELVLEKHKEWLETNGRSGEKAYLREADLREAYLRGADLRGADLGGADLRGADLSNGAYQVVGSGSVNRCTTYFSVNDMVVCGCWNDGNGNTLESFKKRIESIYGEEGEKPNPLYYQEYRAAIAFFEAVRDLKAGRK